MIGIILLFLLIISVVLYDLIFKPFKRPESYHGITHEAAGSNTIRIQFPSGRRMLRGYIYGGDNKNGLIIFAHGIGNSSNYYIPEILYFVGHGYRVFCFDYSGYWENEGKRFGGILQASLDLKCAIDYIAKENTLPITLIGHSMGGFAVCSVLNLTDISIRNVVAFAGFNNATEMIRETLKRMNKFFGMAACPLVLLVQKIRYGKLTKITSADGLNGSNVRAFIIHGNKDAEIDINGSAIFAKKREITNRNVFYRPCDEEGFNTHMGIVRKDKTADKINQKLLDEIIAFIR